MSRSPQDDALIGRLTANYDYQQRQIDAAKASFEAACRRADRMTLLWHENRREITKLNAALRRKNAYIKRLRAVIAVAP